MQLIIRKFFIISLFIIGFEFNQSKVFSTENYNFEDFGLISIMYHRFNENKYPSTNIQLEVFKKQLNIIEKEGIKFIHPKDFEKSLSQNKKERKILLTVDDGLLSFYNNAWPILKEKKIPFILFVNTREVGSFNYMNWEQIIELHKSENVEIGNHSHSHEYLVDENSEFIKKDILTSIKIFEERLGKNSDFFSYPFGEYSNEFKTIIKDFGFKYAFGQHSGVIDETKDLWELPRFPINEKYGEIKRFNTLMKTLPLKYKKLTPEDRYLLQSRNPPKVKIQFYEDIKNLDKINCFSNEGNKWRNSNIFLEKNNILEITIAEKFIGERGRINCSLQEVDGFWRWLGVQYVISEK
ncbi:MAG: polysaccharide deacetylase family protein [Pseudomonadota bacterium]|nr:polysaccharide deacetylase family protein [Pseudomonadota bacterium]